MTPGAVLFGRYAFPPNELGYCGPEDVSWTDAILGPGEDAEARHVALQFTGAWPYLELIGRSTGLDPLDQRVVEAYWLGNELLDEVDLLTWGNSLDERFRRRSGSRWAQVDATVAVGGPTHAHHVFCVYPWVGLLRSGHTEQALTVIDRCRIRWGSVVASVGDELLVRSRPLEWDGRALLLAEPRVERVRSPLGGASVAEGDTVSLHWGHACQVIDDRRRRWLASDTARHLAAINRPEAALAVVLGD